MEEEASPRTESTSLRNRTLVGLSWRTLTTGGRVILRLIVGVTLARLLQPEDFGLLGLATIIIGFGDLFVDIGLGPAIIQRKTLTKRHIRVGFTLSLVGGLALCTGVYAGAPFAAQLFESKALVPIIEVMSLAFLFSGFGAVSRALLKRALDFRSVLVVDLGGYLVGYGGIGITMALLGFGVWSLIAASVVQTVLSACISYGFVRHSLRPLMAKKEALDLAEFGTGLTLARVVNYMALQGDYFMIGRYLGTSSLGLYTRAYELMKLPLSHFVRILSDVLFPAVSQIQDDPARMRRVFLLTVASIAFFAAPAMVGIVVLAPEIVVGVYGAQWEGAVIPLQILGAAGLFRAVYHGAGAFIHARGWVYSIAACQAAYATSVLVGVWVGAAYYGLNGAAIGVAGSITLMYLLTMVLANAAVEANAAAVARVHLPGILLAFPVGAGTLAGKYLGSALGAGNLIELVLGTLGGVGVGLIFVRVVPLRWLEPVSTFLVETATEQLPPHVSQRLRRWVGHQPASTPSS